MRRIKVLKGEKMAKVFRTAANIDGTGVISSHEKLLGVQSTQFRKFS